MGHEAVKLGDGRELLERLLADPPDLVFNTAEGQGIGRCREARVPAVLEMLGRFNEDLTALQRAIRWGEGDKLQDLFTRTRAIRRGIIDARQA